MSNLLFVILLAILTEVIGLTKYSKVLPTAAGGQFVEVSDFPYTVAIFEGDDFKCTGSYIKPNFILTAAHCVAGYVKNGSATVDTLILKMGIAKLTDKSGQTRNSASIILHNNYDSMGYRSDIALIGIKRPFDLNSNVQMIRLAQREEEYVNYRAVLAGWACGVFMGQGVLEHMRSIEVAIISRTRCENIYSTVNYEISPDTYCAGPPQENRNACHGDSGAALTFTQPKLQIAIVSLGMGCGRAFPGVYSSVAYHKEWISSRSEYQEYLERDSHRLSEAVRCCFGCFKVLNFILLCLIYRVVF